MTASVRGTPRLSAVPASQNTAPVAEFRCLFTHDTRKKQKKWQDGYLKFHSFNSRVIVYDASRFTVGDTYYKDSDELHEGDELMLDKGVMVEVAEPVGVTQTDLTPLFDRKTKASPERNNATGHPKPPSRPTVPVSNPLRAASQLRHKSLNALLGTPRGPIGKATPIRSPFELRVEQENLQTEERAAKRQKTAHEVPIEPVPSRTALKQTAPQKPRSLAARQTHTRVSGALPRAQAVPHGATVISLSSQPEADEIPSDVTLPHTPSKPDQEARPQTAPNVPERRPPNAAHLTPKLPRGKVPVPKVKAQQTPRPRVPPSSPPVSASNRIINVDFAVEPAFDPPREASPVPSPKPAQVIERKKTKFLKLSTGPKRGMLLCQSAPTRKITSLNEPKKRASKSVQVDGDMALRDSHGQVIPLQDSMKRMGTGVDAGTTVGPSLESLESAEGTEQAPLDLLGDMEMAHGFMDQQLLVTSSPPSLPRQTASRSPPTPKASTAQLQSSTKGLSKSIKRAKDSSTEDATLKPNRTKAKRAKDAVEKPSVRKKKPDKTNSPVPPRSQSPIPFQISAEVSSREVSVPPSRTTKRLQNSPTSLSPGKLTALSTGGIQKKTKRAKECSTASNNPAPVSPLRPRSVALPPHPLRSSKNGPLMSTTELSALLQSGPRSMRLEDDPIDDSTQGDSNVSPSKRSGGIKRTRSENDARIPSTSEDWEQRNLPRPSETDSSASTAATKSRAGGLASLIRKTDPWRKFQRAQSLSVEPRAANKLAEVPEVLTPPVDHDVGPWSTEAFDLFDWKPPGKEWVADGARMRLVDVEGDGGVGLLVDWK